MDGVDVGDEAERRLRPAGRDHLPDRQTAQRVRALRMAQRVGRLREDVVRVGVAGMHERSVARLVEVLQPGSRRVHARRLRADADPRVALPQQLLLHLHEVGGALGVGGHVQPFDDDDAVELRGVGGPPDEHPHGVAGGRVRRDLPRPVHPERPDRLERRRRAGEEVFGLGVARLRQLRRRHRRERLAARAAGDRTRDDRECEDERHHAHDFLKPQSERPCR